MHIHYIYWVVFGLRQFMIYILGGFEYCNYGISTQYVYFVVLASRYTPDMYTWGTLGILNSNSRITWSNVPCITVFGCPLMIFPG